MLIASPIPKLYLGMHLFGKLCFRVGRLTDFVAHPAKQELRIQVRSKYSLGTKDKNRQR